MSFTAQSVAEVTPPLEPLPRYADRPNAGGKKKPWGKRAGTLISLSLLAAALWQCRQLDFAIFKTLMPGSAAFWLVYAAYYLATPLSEWVIFRRLWDLPPAGIVPLLRKKVSNELILGYLGEVYFYSWARRHSHIVSAPFGAIKDVAILSAMMGNIVTLAMVAAGASLFFPLIRQVEFSISQQAVIISVAFLAITSALVLFLRRQIFSLPLRELVFVSVMHTLRILAGIGLLALLWHLALPDVALIWWALLALLRQLVSRLPFVPNKDVVFASIAIFLLGEDAKIAALMALIAGVLLATHLVVALVLGLAGLVKGEEIPDEDR
ncbi:MAG: hypothetical protein PHE36_10310 [Novosphingobium sp.]|nr:hypothetical protein [Novosphingobium sp.]